VGDDETRGKEEIKMKGAKREMRAKEHKLRIAIVVV
jgi:hypothetical protein